MRWDLATRWPGSATNAISRRRRESKPVLIKSRITHTESAAAIDRQVREFLERGESLYSVDFEILRAIEPDLIVTQDLCHVCAATPDDLGAALAHLERQPRVVTLNPHSLADVCADIRAVGEATGRAEQAEAVVAEFERDIASVERSVAGLDRPRVLCLEWLDPPYVAGHWVPEMVERAGGVDVLGQAGKAVLSRGLGNGARGAARSDRHHAVRL